MINSQIDLITGVFENNRQSRVDAGFTLNIYRISMAQTETSGHWEGNVKPSQFWELENWYVLHISSFAFKAANARYERLDVQRLSAFGTGPGSSQSHAEDAQRPKKKLIRKN